MHRKKGTILSKDEFLRNSDYSKEEYEGLLVSADTRTGVYNIGVQLSENQVVLIEQANDNNIHEKYQQLVPKVQEIQKKYR